MSAALTTFFALLAVGVAVIWLALFAPSLVSAGSRGGAALSQATLLVAGIVPAISVALGRDFYHRSTDDQVRLSGAALRMSQAGTLLLAVLSGMALLAIVRRATSPRSGYVLGLVGFGSAMIVSSIFNDSFDTNLLLFPMTVLAAATCYASPPLRIALTGRFVLRLVIGMSLLLYFVSRDQATLNGATGGRFLSIEQLAGLAPHPNGLGFLAALMLAVELHVSVGRLRSVAIVAAVIALVLSQSRGAWLGAILVLLLWSLGRWGATRTILITTAAVAVGWTAVREVITASGLTGRETAWELAWTAFADSPLLGGGPSALSSVVAGSALEWAGQAHNQVLDTLAKTGLIGLGCLAVASVSAVRRALVHRAHGNILPLGLLVIIAARALVESPVGMGFPTLFVVALLATAQSGLESSHPDIAEVRERYRVP